MKPIYHHYELWEDYQNGMYNESKDGRKERVQKAIDILSDPALLYECMKKVTTDWTHASEQNLSNEMYGHRSFLGQSACSIYAGIHEDETREAWGKLTDIQRIRANQVADRVYEEWKTEHMRNSKGNYQMGLFEDIA